MSSFDNLWAQKAPGPSKFFNEQKEEYRYFYAMGISQGEKATLERIRKDIELYLTCDGSPNYAHDISFCKKCQLKRGIGL